MSCWRALQDRPRRGIDIAGSSRMSVGRTLSKLELAKQRQEDLRILLE